MKEAEREFILLPFKATPLTQPFRYKNNWWAKTAVHGGGYRLPRFPKTHEEMMEILEFKQFIKIDLKEIVATENSPIAAYSKYTEELGL